MPRNISTTPAKILVKHYLQELIDVVSNIVIDKFGVEGSEICVVDVFEDQGRCFALHHE